MLEEYYKTSTHSQCKWFTSLMLVCMSHSRECIHSTSARSVAQYHGKSIEPMSCVFTHFCYVDSFKLGVCLSSLLHLSYFLVRIAFLFAYQAFTIMGQPMHRWMHWKYHFTWSGPCTVNLGVAIVLAFNLFSCMLVCLLSLFFCLSTFLLAYSLYFHICFYFLLCFWLLFFLFSIG